METSNENWDGQDAEAWQFADKKRHEAAETSCRALAQSIVERVKKLVDAPDYKDKEKLDLHVNPHTYGSKDEQHSARGFSIRTHFGAVVVLPDFSDGSAKAFILNRGKIRGMLLEGFTYDFIEENGKIYSDEFKSTVDDINALGWFLTRFMNRYAGKTP